MRIAAVIHSLERGGAEKNFSLLVNELAERGHDVRALTFDARTPFYPLKNIAVTPLIAKPAAWHALPKLLFQLRGELRRYSPDAIVSFMDQTNVLTLLAAAGLKTPVVVAERNNPERNLIGPRAAPEPLQQLGRAFRRRLYKRAAAVTVQTKGAVGYFSNHPKVIAIPNPVGSASKLPRDLQQRPKRILTLARLVREKNLELILRSFASVATEVPDWSLRIRGNGPLGLTLAALVVELGIQGRVEILPATDDATAEYQAARVFVLASDFEGFPNALAEAMAHGCACISSDCPYGPAELIENGKNGILIRTPTRESLSAEIKRLCCDDGLQEGLGAKAQEIATKYTVKDFGDSWEDLLKECAIRK